MSHLRQWRCFQVRNIGSVFHTGVSLGEFVVNAHECVCVCAFDKVHDDYMYECLIVVMHVYVKQEKLQKGQWWTCEDVFRCI